MTTFSAEAWLTITNALVATAICSSVVFAAVLALCSLFQTTAAVRCNLLRVASATPIDDRPRLQYSFDAGAGRIDGDALPAYDTAPPAMPVYDVAPPEQPAFT